MAKEQIRWIKVGEENSNSRFNAGPDIGDVVFVDGVADVDVEDAQKLVQRHADFIERTGASSASTSEPPAQPPLTPLDLPGEPGDLSADPGEGD